MPRPVLLEAEVRECLVGFCHTVHFVTLLHRTATAFIRFYHLATQTLRHGLFATLVCGFAQPTHRQRHTAHWTHFNRNLVVGTADTTGLHFDHRLAVAQRSGEHFQRVFTSFGLNVLKGTVNDVFSDRLFAGQHQHVDELSNINIAELWIRQDFPLGYFTTTWHFNSFQSSVERAE